MKLAFPKIPHIGIDKNKPDELALYERYKHLTGNREQLIKEFP